MSKEIEQHLDRLLEADCSCVTSPAEPKQATQEEIAHGWSCTAESSFGNFAHTADNLLGQLDELRKRGFELEDQKAEQLVTDTLNELPAALEYIRTALERRVEETEYEQRD